jgi:hypothetical protein
MPRRILNRLELRDQGPDALDSDDSQSEPAPVEKKKRVKGLAAPKVRKPRVKKPVPRRRARWGVFNVGMRQVAIFEYSERAAADDKLADLLARNKGEHFLQIVVDLMPDPVAEALPA